MPEEYPSISKSNPEFPNYLNFQILRDIGIAHLQNLSGKLWTDYNLHDPGITILEVLCYAVTDLGYRNNLDIQDLLALNPADSNRRENNFFTPDEILTCNPVTELDLRKRLIDIPGVRNAWLEKVTGEEVKYNPAIHVDYAKSRLYIPPDNKSEENAPRLHPRGLYIAYIDLDLEYRKNPCGQIERSWSGTLDKVKAVLCNYRNLCEDIYDIVVLGEEEIALGSDIELEADADAEDVLVDIYVRLQAFLSPSLNFYTLQELLDKGKNLAEIFAGRPAVLHDERYEDKRYHSHGFVDTTELEALNPPTEIHTSDLYQEILKVPGVAAVRKLSITNYINGLPQSQEHPWHLRLTKGYSPVLGIKFSKINLFKGVLPILTNFDEVKRRYYEQQAAYIKAFYEDYELDLPVPPGSYYNLADHYSIQHDFPLTYGISEDGLPETVSVLRKAQARQLKGYLVFFDQLLANYLVQLAHVRDLFTWEIDEANSHEKDRNSRTKDLQHAYFTQALDFPEIAAILGDASQYLESIKEEPHTYRDRRNSFLDHLLARFAESFVDYALLNYRVNQENQNKVEYETEMIREKAQFLQDYPTLSRDRFRAFNYCNCKQVWDIENVSGFKKRVSRLLGIEDVQRRNLCHYRIIDGWKISLSGNSDDIVVIFALSLLILRGLHRLALLLLQDSLESSQTYAKEEEAENNLEKLLLFALHENFYKRLIYPYDNAATGSTCYKYVLVDEKGQVLAENTLRFSTAQKREIALQKYFSNIQFNQNQYKFTVEQSTNGYFFTIKNKTDNQTLLRSLKEDFTGEVEAWQSAGALTEHLRYLNRYVVSLSSNEAAKNHSLEIVDLSGKVLASGSITEADPLETFKQLNSVEPFLRIEAVTEQTRAYRFRLVDRSGVTLLQGTKVLENESEVRDHFYRDLLGILDERVIYPTATPDGFGFRVLSRPPNQKSEVAIHPQTYQTAAERDAVINRLFLLVRTARLSIKIEKHYIGLINGEDEQILLQSKKYYNNMQDAWQQSNILIELAQNSSNFRLIDSENGIYGWELTNEQKDKILANHYYTSEEERNQSIKTLQQRIDDEGFHVLEHILLRPKTKQDECLPIYVNTDDATPGESSPLTYQDPYSFWISVILPYWPKRFRNMDFRRFVERTLRIEAPAHVAIKIAWLDVRQMKEFEVAYHEWLEQLALDACYGSACDLTGALNRLLEIIPELRSVYPKGILYDIEGSVTQGQPIILNQTALGTAND